jgi:hypothetical protein
VEAAAAWTSLQKESQATVLIRARKQRMRYRQQPTQPLSVHCSD